MKFIETAIDGVMIVELERRVDGRGSFARWYCDAEVTAAGLAEVGTQINTSSNNAAGTLRGMHWQAAPHGEAKLLRCVHGAVFDVAVDVRPGSPSLGAHVGVELTGENQLGLYLSAEMAHGYLSLSDGATVIYQSSTPYAPGHERGLRWDDPLLGIEWPAKVVDVSDKARSWPLLGSFDELVTPPS